MNEYEFKGSFNSLEFTGISVSEFLSVSTNFYQCQRISISVSEFLISISVSEFLISISVSKFLSVSANFYQCQQISITYAPC